MFVGKCCCCRRGVSGAMPRHVMSHGRICQDLASNVCHKTSCCARLHPPICDQGQVPCCMDWTTPCYLRGPFAKEGSVRDFECESDMPKWTLRIVRFKIWHAAMGPTDVDMLISQAHEHMLMGLTHERMLMGLAHEHLLIALGHTPDHVSYIRTSAGYFLKEGWLGMSRYPDLAK